MFESPLQRALSRFNSNQATEWDYVNELHAMSEWLCHGGEQSDSLTAATRSIDTFRGPPTVKRWIHALTTFELHNGDPGCPFDVYLDSIVDGKVERGPGHRRGLEAELSQRMGVLDDFAGLSENYRCALLLKEGHGLTVEQTADLMETSTASLRSILYRARQTLRV